MRHILKSLLTLCQILTAIKRPVTAYLIRSRVIFFRDKITWRTFKVCIESYFILHIPLQQSYNRLG